MHVGGTLGTVDIIFLVYLDRICWMESYCWSDNPITVLQFSEHKPENLQKLIPNVTDVVYKVLPRSLTKAHIQDPFFSVSPLLSALTMLSPFQNIQINTD